MTTVAPEWVATCSDTLPCRKRETARPDHDRVKAAALGEHLDLFRRVTEGLRELGADAMLSEDLHRFPQLLGVDGGVVPRIDRHTTGMDGNNARDRHVCAGQASQLDRRFEGTTGGFASVVSNQDALHRHHSLGVAWGRRGWAQAPTKSISRERRRSPKPTHGTSARADAPLARRAAPPSPPLTR